MLVLPGRPRLVKVPKEEVRLARRQQQRRKRALLQEQIDAAELSAFATVNRAMSGEIELLELRACMSHVACTMRRVVASGGDASRLQDWLEALKQTLPHIGREPSSLWGLPPPEKALAQRPQSTTVVGGGRGVDVDDLVVTPSDCGAAARLLREQGVVVVRDAVSVDACRLAREYVVRQHRRVRDGDNGDGKFNINWHWSSTTRVDMTVVMNSEIADRPRARPPAVRFA